MTMTELYQSTAGIGIWGYALAGVLAVVASFAILPHKQSPTGLSGIRLALVVLMLWPCVSVMLPVG